MSIRDIIEAAKSDWVLEGMSPAGGMFLDHEDDQRFIATFDPEHVALMEAVCEAAKARHQEWTRDTYIAIDDAMNALTAYRKTHGYGD